MIALLAIALGGEVTLRLPREGLAPLPVVIRFDDAQRPEPRAVIVWSHGLFGSAAAYRPLVDAWVDAGFVVVQPTHDDTLEGRSARDKARHLQQADLTVWSQRPLDVKAAIDALPTVKGLPPLDLDRLGVGGHSFGAHTSMLVAGVRVLRHADLWDERPDAFLWISPQGVGPMIQAESFAPVTRPVLVVTGSEDRQPKSENGAEWRLTAWEAMDAPARLLFVEGGHHNFGGISGPTLPGAGPADPALVTWLTEATTGWWDEQLRGAPAGPWADTAQATARSGGRVRVEEKAPPDPLAGVDWVRPAKELTGDALTVVEVWATWCGPCRTSLPELAALQEANPELRVVALTDEPLDVVRAFLPQLPPSLAVAVDPDGQRVRGLMFGGYGGRGIPSAYLMRGGRVIWGGETTALAEAITAHR
jgi:thiol-disulfide isomerase/thioredoxin/dienelactone hydrolase